MKILIMCVNKTVKYYIGCARKPDGFWNLKTSLPATRRFHTDSCAQCCLEFSWDGNVATWVNKIFHFAFKRYLISKTVRYIWGTLYMKEKKSTSASQFFDVCGFTVVVICAFGNKFQITICFFNVT
jgi:hypothetical protein